MSLTSRPPTLRIHAPTPTTVSYTVSTRPYPDTFPLLLLHHTKLLIRIICGLLISVLLFAKWRLTFPLPEAQQSDIESLVLSGAIGTFAFKIAQAIDWRVLGPACLAVGMGVLTRGYTEESLLVLRGLGIQTSSSSATYLSSSVTRFIPTTSIQDIFIHEAFKGFQVRFYLAVVVSGEEDVVVVFPKLLPRRQILEEVWRGTRKCLHEPPADK
ncbi:hypothetical protein EJ05DRAFT_211830 [Pseudovirgaria hyperparasitica]|uniref:Phosphatidylinositol N-acetylglucosaminyltransferase subunit H conserved domain-containing protein n=1 Tax=Pseudovirgaria hyperparasitica TaxID=470096 RepID=A0A6A6VTX1_9PEZI|nr:uncharacterized protein EJ05DRAFT_211830 [Pseudovirgaria hyperparasitica]KAF2753339.1 hypothetical protein EJ05DRAFT_211830 [Pseudovirgaria hyperparasitica]